MSREDLRVGRHVVPAFELDWEFDPSGGPGGQHANRSSTRVTLRFDLAASSAFPEDLRRRMLDRLGQGTVTVVVDETRSQWRNRELARRRLAERLLAATRAPRRRRPTRPTRASKEERLAEKRRRSEVKRLRGRPPDPNL